MHGDDTGPLTYLVLGLRGAQRRALVADLIAGYFSPEEVVRVGIPAAEGNDSEGAAALAERATTEVIAYQTFHDIGSPDKVAATFLLPPGDGHPADAVEAFANWLKVRRTQPSRIITVVHSRLQAEYPEPLTLWHRACIHFSDAVLLARREGLAPSALKAFLTFFEKERYPCPIELVKKGRVANPALILEPQPRRMSLMFDRDLEAVDLLEFDEDNLPDQPIDLVKPADKYLATDDSGQRLIRIPNIAGLLEPDERD